MRLLRSGASAEFPRLPAVLLDLLPGACVASGKPRAEEPRGFTDVRLHWHVGGTSFLAGDYHAGYWRGPAGCPPECPGVKPPNTRSEPVPEGREGISAH